MASWYSVQSSGAPLDVFFTAADLTMLSTGSSTGTPNVTVIQAMLDRAQRLITMELSSLGTINDATVTAKGSVLYDIGLDLACEMLFGRISGEAAKIPDAWRDRISRAWATLQRIKNSELAIPEITIAANGPSRSMAVLGKPGPNTPTSADIDSAFNTTFPFTISGP